MEGELIRINHNEENMKFSIVHWETGEPKHVGAYLVTYRNTETLLNVCTCLYRMGYIWVNGDMKEIDSDLFVAWWRLKDIRPCKE